MNPADSPDQPPDDRTVARTPGNLPFTVAAPGDDLTRTRTAAAPYFGRHDPRTAGDGATYTFNPGALPDSGVPASGRVIRGLNDWIDQHREAIDVGEYKLLRSIGTGAFGTVWEGHNFETGERVAIKFLTAGDARWEEMLAEVKILQALEGTGGIVSVKRVRRGNPTQPPYYVMPLANHGSLADRVKAAAGDGTAAPDKPVLPVPEAVRVFTRVAAALAAVHRRGIHHCDLKPQNVLLHATPPGDPPDPLLADFGQAHLATDDTPALGTFFYMPPDQADAALRNARSDSGWDVYALGAVLYEMLTGTPPRKDDALVQELRGTEHLETKLALYHERLKAAPAPTAHRKLADPLLVKIIDRCLSLDPAVRPHDAGEVVDLLKHRAWWRQVRSLLALAAVGAVLFLLFVGGISYKVASDVRDRAKASAAREIGNSLARTAWYGRNAVEHDLQDQVAFVERQANGCPPGVREALADTSDAVAAAGHDWQAIGDRKKYADWVVGARREMVEQWGASDSYVALKLVTRDGVKKPGGVEAHHGFTLAVADRGGAKELGPVSLETDWAFRDYFNGERNKYDETGRPHPVVRHTHISHTYQSQGEGHPWLIDITTPVWAAPGKNDRVVGLLTVTVPIDHLESRLQLPDGMISLAGEDAAAVQAFVVNDRGAWVWHPDGMPRMEHAPDPPRDPDRLPGLAAALDAAFGPDDPDTAGYRDHGWAGEYTDPIQGDAEAELVHVLPVYPYARSEYPGVKGKEWWVVAQVNKAAALRPLVTLQDDLFRAGSIMVAALFVLTAGLGVGLFRVLRGWEFAGHG